MIPRGRTVVAGAGQVRALSAVLALLYLATAGLIAYFRLGPVQRVMERLERDGASIPAWFPLVFTAGPVIIAGFVLFQGARHLRRALGSSAPRGE